jgi:hypothetical protein
MDDDTAQAPPADEPETGSVNCPTSADHTVLAWSADDGSDERQRRSWWDTGRIAALTLIGTGICGALIWVAAPLVWQPTTVTTPATPTAAPALEPTTSTVTQTVTATPASPAALPTTTPGPDDRFAAIMRGQHMPPELNADTARGVCQLLGLGGSFTKESERRTLVMNTGITPEQATSFVGAAVEMYCPQYSDNY